MRNDTSAAPGLIKCCVTEVGFRDANYQSVHFIVSKLLFSASCCGSSGNHTLKHPYIKAKAPIKKNRCKHRLDLNSSETRMGNQILKLTYLTNGETVKSVLERARTKPSTVNSVKRQEYNNREASGRGLA